MQAEGIFRINAENGQEEYVREQLNRGVVPDGIDVHCLAGLIKVLLGFFSTIYTPSPSPPRVVRKVFRFRSLNCIFCFFLLQNHLDSWYIFAELINSYRNLICSFAGLVQRTSIWCTRSSFSRAGDAVPVGRRMHSACEASSTNRSCSARLGDKPNGWCCSTRIFEQDECT